MADGKKDQPRGEAYLAELRRRSKIPVGNSHDRFIGVARYLDSVCATLIPDYTPMKDRGIEIGRVSSQDLYLLTKDMSAEMEIRLRTLGFSNALNEKELKTLINRYGLDSVTLEPKNQ